MRCHYHELVRVDLLSFYQGLLQLFLHCLILLGSSFLIDFKKRIEEEESCTIGESEALYPLKVTISCWQSTNYKAILEKIHAFGKHALMVPNCSQNGPKSSDSWYLVKKQKIHLTVVSLKVISVISVEDHSINSPLICLFSTFYLELPLGKYIIKRIV